MASSHTTVTWEDKISMMKWKAIEKLKIRATCVMMQKFSLCKTSTKMVGLHARA